MSEENKEPKGAAATDSVVEGVTRVEAVIDIHATTGAAVDLQANEPTAPDEALAGLFGPDGHPLVLPKGMREGRVFQSYVVFQIESDRGAARFLSLWSPLDMDALTTQVQPHIVSNDPREKCESYPRLIEQVREHLEDQFVNTLRAGNYPAFCDETGAPMANGGMNPKHPFKRVDIYYGAHDSPVSVFIVYWYDALAPVVAEIPPELLPRLSCGMCDACDPTWENRRAIQDQLAAAGIPEGVDTVVLGVAPNAGVEELQGNAADVPHDSQETAAQPDVREADPT